jgi:hypothetical protein
VSVQAALDFVSIVRAERDIQQRVAGLGRSPTIAQLVALAQEVGCDCSADDLAEGFRQDWIMRWMYETRLADSPAGERPRLDRQ